jgi:hypothetical protein
MKKAGGLIIALLFGAFVGQPSFAILRAGNKLIPFSLKGIDGKTATVILEDGRLTLLSSSPEGGGTVTRKSHPAAVLIDFWATWFCKWVCPAGALEAGIPLKDLNAARGGVGARVLGVWP